MYIEGFVHGNVAPSFAKRLARHITSEGPSHSTLCLGFRRLARPSTPEGARYGHFVCVRVRLSKQRLARPSRARGWPWLKGWPSAPEGACYGHLWRCLRARMALLMAPDGGPLLSLTLLRRPSPRGLPCFSRKQVHAKGHTHTHTHTQTRQDRRGAMLLGLDVIPPLVQHLHALICQFKASKQSPERPRTLSITGCLPL